MGYSPADVVKNSVRVMVVSLAALGLCGFDWPGAVDDVAARFETARGDDRAALILGLSSADTPAAQALLRRALEDPELPVREAAIRAVARLRATSLVPSLLPLAGDGTAEVRGVVVEALGAWGDPSARPMLVRALADPDTTVRVRAIDALAAQGGADAVLPLLDRVHDPERDVRSAAIRALARLGDARAVLPLLGAIQDALPEVRAAVADALGQLRDPRAVRGLLGLLHDPVADVRAAAIVNLGQLGPRGAEALDDLAQLAFGELRAQDPAQRASALYVVVQAIRHIGGAQGVDVLVRLFVQGSETEASLAADALEQSGDAARARVPTLVETTPALRLDRLIPLLGAVGGDSAADALTQLLDRPGLTRNQRGAVMNALGRTGSTRALRPLLDALGATTADQYAVSQRPYQCRGSTIPVPPVEGLRALSHALGRLDDRALDPLLERLAAVDPACPALAAELVALVGDTRSPRAVRTLLPLLDDARSSLRAAAARALVGAELGDGDVALVARLRDEAPVRALVADALALRGSARVVAEIVRTWNDRPPVDHVAAARVLGRVIARDRTISNDLRAQCSARLRDAAEHGAPTLAEAALDALGDLAGAGDVDALGALLRRVGEGPVTTRRAALEALSTAGAGLDADARARAAAAARAVADDTSQDITVRASAAWALGALSDDAAPLMALATSPWEGLATNALAAAVTPLTRAAPGDRAAVVARLCALRGARAVGVQANASIALGALGEDCDGALEASLGRERHEVLARAAAFAVRALARSEAHRAAAEEALARCARLDADAGSATCRAVVAQAAGPDTTVDAQVDEGPGVSYALALPDGRVRVGVTGAGGWLHVRPVPAGSFRVMSPEALSRGR